MSDPRPQQAFDIRVEAARLARRREIPPQTPRGDDTSIKTGSYTKGLPHVRETGIIENPDHFDLFVSAINSSDVKEISELPLGPSGPKNDRFISGIARGGEMADVRAWESMAAGNAFDLEGPDAQSVAMPPHPALDSDELVAEMTEIYWMSLIRDVPFVEFDDNNLVGQAIQDMNQTEWVRASTDPPKGLSEAERQRLRGPFRPKSIFRGILKGDEVGPYLSQFLLSGTKGIVDAQDPADGYIAYGGHRIDQRVRYAEPNKDYMTTWASWLDVQNGADLRGRETYRKGYRFMATPRDLATYVHYDALYQAYLNACLILLDIKAPFDDGIPSQPNTGIPFRFDDDVDKQQGFALFGGPHILTLVTEVATRALKAVRYQKFNVHLRPRPERLAGLIERHHHEPESNLYSAVAPLYNSLEKDLLNRIARENGRQNREYRDFDNPRFQDYDPVGTSGENFLLPMAFPEGSPMHPSYGAGHATVAGACVTILKAWFKCDYKLPFAFEPSKDGKRLLKRPNLNLTVGGELNKVCSNISIGRNWAGVHYFTDYIESIKIGEEIAIGLLEEQALTYQEKFSMTLEKFDGTRKTIRSKGM